MRYSSHNLSAGDSVDSTLPESTRQKSKAQLRAERRAVQVRMAFVLHLWSRS